MVFGLVGRVVSGTWNFVKRHPVAIATTVVGGIGVVAGVRRLIADAEGLQGELQAYVQEEYARERRYGPSANVWKHTCRVAVRCALALVCRVWWSRVVLAMTRSRCVPAQQDAAARVNGAGCKHRARRFPAGVTAEHIWTQGLQSGSYQS